MTDESTTPTQPETPEASDATADADTTSATGSSSKAVEVSDAPPTPPSSPAVSIDNPFNLVLTGICVAGVVLALVLGDDKLWDVMGWTWAILAIVAAVATAVPSLASLPKLDDKVGKEIQTVAVVFLGLWWVLFVMPQVETNQGFLATVGVFAAGVLVWRSRSTVGTDQD